MAKLEDHHKQFIIEQLAEFRTYAEISRLLQSEFDVAVDRFQIRTLDPTHPRFVGSEKLRELFEAKRAAYMDHVNDLPIASDAFRLRQLQDFFFRARDLGNMGLALKILKQAEEAADKINARQPKEEDRPGSFRHMTPDERRQAVADMLREALGGDRVPKQVQQHESVDA